MTGPKTRAASDAKVTLAFGRLKLRMNHSHAKKTQHNTASLAAPCSPQPRASEPLSSLLSPQSSHPRPPAAVPARLAPEALPPGDGSQLGQPRAQQSLPRALTPGTGCPPESSLGRREPLGGREPLGDSVLCKAQESSESALHRNRTVHATFGDGVQEGCQKLPFFFLWGLWHRL